MNVLEELFANQDLKYKAFQSKLVPNIDEQLIIGVRIPVLRKIAGQIVKEPAEIGSHYYEEQMLRGFVIGYSKEDIDVIIEQLNEFVPAIDNWAVCDCTCATLKIALKYQTEIWDLLLKLIKTGKEYSVRFAVVMMLNYYLNDNYIDDVLMILKNVKSDYYYVNMSLAWALSCAYIDYPEKIMAIIKNNELSPSVHNKTIQKICESYRVCGIDKQKLKKYKR